MRDIDGRRAQLLLDPHDLATQLDAQARVEVRQRLVHQEDARIAHERPPHRNPLPLPAG
ncbi:MAG TPA: hypothetical protein VHF88_05235 [Thermoleophilaceae bacterium]|nr:hypothetical protein [Thermoleophilaceae bacterium]